MKSLVDLIYRLKDSCRENELNIMTEAGLSPAEYNGIAAIEPSEMVCGSTISRKMNLSPSRASRVVEKMVKNGYLTRETDTGDRRKCNITLAEKGVKVKEQINKLRAECENHLKKNLSPQEIETFSNTIQKIVNVL